MHDQGGGLTSSYDHTTKEDEDITKRQGDGGGSALNAYDPLVSDIHATKEDHVKAVVLSSEESFDKDDQLLSI